MRSLLLLLLILVGACTAGGTSKRGPSRTDAKQFLESLARTTAMDADQQPYALATACSAIPACAKPCGPGLYDYGLSDRIEKNLSILQSCSEASAAVFGDPTRFGPGGPGPDEIDQAVAAYVRRRTAAYADQIRDVLSPQDRPVLDQVRATLSL